MLGRNNVGEILVGMHSCNWVSLSKNSPANIYYNIIIILNIY